MNDSLEAWIIHKQWRGDTSANITFWTKEQGIITCLMKGARNVKKSPIVQPFIPLWINFRQKNEWRFLNQCEPISRSLNLTGTALLSALYLNELLFYLMRPCDAEPFLFEAYTQSLQELSRAPGKTALEIVLRTFESNALSTCGFHLVLLYDKQGNEICANQFYQYAPAEGFIPAARGILGKWILAFANQDFSSPEVLIVAKNLMRVTINFVLEGKELKSRSLFKKHNYPEGA
jgi:DNA repair protein RecO (recombination protein O)